MEEIATEAGFSRGAIYGNFGSKEELLLAVMERFISRQLLQYQQQERRDDHVAAAVDAAALFRQTSSVDVVPLELELRMNALRHPQFRQRLAEADRRMSEANARLVREMVGTTADLRIPARDLADIGRAAVLGLLQYAAVDEQQRDRYEALIETVFLLLTDAVLDKK